MKEGEIPHINLEQLFQMKIPTLKGRSGATNSLILETIALEGPLLKYDVYKKLKNKGIAEYSTITRRIDSLKEKGYLDKASKRITERGKQKAESMYGLTWKGFVASTATEDVKKNIIRVLRINPLLSLPEKDLILQLIEEIATQQEIEAFTGSLLKALLESVVNLEILDEEQIPIAMGLALTKMQPPKDFKLSRIPEDAWELLDKPTFFQIVKEKIVPFLKQYADGIKAMYQLVSAFEGFDKLIYELDTVDQPSKKVKEFVETRFQNLLPKKQGRLRN